MAGGLRGPSSLWWGPDGAEPVAPAQAGFSLNRLLWLPDGVVPLVPGPPAPAPEQRATDEDSRDYEKLPYQRGEWGKHLGSDRFRWTRPGGGTPSRH